MRAVQNNIDGQISDCSTMRSSQMPYVIGLAIVLVVLGMAGSSLLVHSARAGEEISIATLEYAPFT